MSIQTTYLRPEDDPANWFTATEVVGPAIITAVIGGQWRLYDRVPPDGATRPILVFAQDILLHRTSLTNGAAGS